MRIARDLHDVVAHNISVINVQANTALHLMDRQPDRARTAPTTINEVSGQALAELRSVLGVLRAVDESEPRAPARAWRGWVTSLYYGRQATDAGLHRLGMIRTVAAVILLAATLADRSLARRVRG